MTNARLIVTIESAKYQICERHCISNQRMEIDASIFNTVSGDSIKDWLFGGDEFRVVDAVIMDMNTGEILCDNIGLVEAIDIEDLGGLANDLEYADQYDIKKANALFDEYPSMTYWEALDDAHNWDIYPCIENEKDLGEHLYHEWNFGDELRKLPELLQDAITIDFTCIAEQYMQNGEDFISDHGWMRKR